MDRDLLSHLQDATDEAQDILGEKFLLNGASFSGVFGQPQIEQQMLSEGGYRTRTVVPLTASRRQFDSPPQEKTVLTRLSPRIEYRIDTVQVHDPLIYFMVLIRVGE